jgi:hypothetical protein
MIRLNLDVSHELNETLETLARKMCCSKNRGIRSLDVD